MPRSSASIRLRFFGRNSSFGLPIGEWRSWMLPLGVRLVGDLTELRQEHVPQPLGPLGQDLIGVPVRRPHHLDDGFDVIVRHVLMEEVAHRVDEDHLRCRPAERLGELLGHEAQVESLLVRVVRDAPESLGERLGVAMLQPGLILVQPRTGFHVASVHSIVELSLIGSSCVGVYVKVTPQFGPT